MLAGQAVPNWQLNTTSYDAGRWYVRRMLYPLTSSMLSTEREFDKFASDSLTVWQALVVRLQV